MQLRLRPFVLLLIVGLPGCSLEGLEDAFGATFGGAVPFAVRGALAVGELVFTLT